MLTLGGGPVGAGGGAGVGGAAGAATGAWWKGVPAAPCVPGVCAALGMNADGCGTCPAQDLVLHAHVFYCAQSGSHREWT